MATLDWRLEALRQLDFREQHPIAEREIRKALLGLKEELQIVLSQRRQGVVSLDEPGRMITRTAKAVYDIAMACTGHPHHQSIAEIMRETVTNLRGLVKEGGGGRLEISRLERIDPAQRSELENLLTDCVNGGASVGFHPPLPASTCSAYWDEVAAEVERGATYLLVARTAAGVLAGSVQLALCPKQNGAHRAELRKLLVLSSHRRRGIGKALLAAAETEARKLGRTLLVLDTQAGTGGVPMYKKAGWTEAGRIPGYTREVDGSHRATAIFYRQL